MRTHLLRAAVIALVAGSAALAEAGPQPQSPAAAQMRTEALRPGGEGVALVARIAAQAMRRVAEVAEGLKRGLSGDR